MTSYVIALPPGLQTLSLNGRYHWTVRRARTEAIRKAAWAMALHQKIPVLKSAAITIIYEPPSKRHFDNDNVPIASGKAAVDGIVSAGILKDDRPPYVTSITGTIGAPFPKGRLVICLTGEPEVASHDQRKRAPHRPVRAPLAGAGPVYAPKDLSAVLPPGPAGLRGRRDARRPPGSRYPAGGIAEAAARRAARPPGDVR